ncbi:ABC transporter substrate-binding protein [Anaeromyxobacter oryzisoli]|uniref:ABC transporter substrate-binding protein n=1 Tax=Anaeromyxobacter oryzisoli TaxID=2925408 RepID=UPI001F5AA15F|nr:ABC transporter substrate-binding protein [Anaeromyxobacter sp. SG63]
MTRNVVHVGSAIRAALILGVLAAAPGVGALPTLKVGYSAGGGSHLTILAQDQKLFQKEGIQVELVPFSSSADGLNALNAGKIDLGVSFGTGAPLTFISKGADFVVIGGHLSGGHPVITLPANASRFRSIQDFKGKTVATARLYTPDIVWRGAMRKAGLDLEKDVRIVELKNPSAVLEAVKAGKADVGIGAASIYVPAKQSGLAIVAWSNDFFPGHPCCRVVAKSRALKEDARPYRAFLKALIEAERLLSTQPELAVAANKKFLDLDDRLARDFTLEPHAHVAADPNRNGVRRMWQEMKAIGYVQSDLDIDRFINVDLYREALSELVRQNPADAYYEQLVKTFEAQNR